MIDPNLVVREFESRDAEIARLRDDVARLTRERDEARALYRAAIGDTGDKFLVRDDEETVERVAHALWTHDEWSPKTLVEADKSNILKVRAGALIYRDKAQTVLAALRSPKKEPTNA